MPPPKQHEPPQTFTKGSRIDIDESITDSIVVTGCLIVTGVSFVTPVGAAVAVAAVGAKDGMMAAAKKGQDIRGGERYQVGDITRGIVSSLPSCNGIDGDRGSEHLSDNSHHGLESSSQPDSSRQYQHHRYAGILGSSAGAAVGLAVAGPLGLIAGSMIGGVAAREMVQGGCNGDYNNDIETDPARPSKATSASTITFRADRSSSSGSSVENDEQSSGPGPDEGKEENGLSLSETVQTIIQRGKEADGRQKNDDYKFGDFTRGLFSSQ